MEKHIKITVQYFALIHELKYGDNNRAIVPEVLRSADLS